MTSSIPREERQCLASGGLDARRVRAATPQAANTSPAELPERLLSLEEMQQQLQEWEKPLN